MHRLGFNKRVECKFWALFVIWSLYLSEMLEERIFDHQLNLTTIDLCQLIIYVIICLCSSFISWNTSVYWSNVRLVSSLRTTNYWMFVCFSSMMWAWFHQVSQSSQISHNVLFIQIKSYVSRVICVVSSVSCHLCRLQLSVHTRSIQGFIRLKIQKRPNAFTV